MTDATDRARRLIKVAAKSNISDTATADHAVTLLLADPDLLTDLALEAGGLEQVTIMGFDGDHYRRKAKNHGG